MLTARGRYAKSDKGSRGNEGNLQNCSCCGKLKMAESPASSLLPYSVHPWVLRNYPVWRCQNQSLNRLSNYQQKYGRFVRKKPCSENFTL